MKICAELLLTSFVLNGHLLQQSQARPQTKIAVARPFSLPDAPRLTANFDDETMSVQPMALSAKRRRRLNSIRPKSTKIAKSDLPAKRSHYSSFPIRDSIEFSSASPDTSLGAQSVELPPNLIQAPPFGRPSASPSANQSMVSSGSQSYSISSLRSKELSGGFSTLNPSESLYPSSVPTNHPPWSKEPTMSPSSSGGPSPSPSSPPTESLYPSNDPTHHPTQSAEPTMKPSSSGGPSPSPSSPPTESLYPSNDPTHHPTQSAEPTMSPSSSGGPSPSPSSPPTESLYPSNDPTHHPTKSAEPTMSPSSPEGPSPSNGSFVPTYHPTQSAEPTMSPSFPDGPIPSNSPSGNISDSSAPSDILEPIGSPHTSSDPSALPTMAPSSLSEWPFENFDGYPSPAPMPINGFKSSSPSNMPSPKAMNPADDVPSSAPSFEPLTVNFPTSSLIQNPLRHQPDWAIVLISIVIAIGSIALIALIFHAYKAHFHRTGNLDSEGSRISSDQQREIRSDRSDSSLRYMLDGLSDDSFDTVDLNQGAFEERPDGFEFVIV